MLFYVWEDAGVWVHWSQFPVFSHPEFPQRSPQGVAIPDDRPEFSQGSPLWWLQLLMTVTSLLIDTAGNIPFFMKNIDILINTSNE